MFEHGTQLRTQRLGYRLDAGCFGLQLWVEDPLLVETIRERYAPFLETDSDGGEYEITLNARQRWSTGVRPLAEPTATYKDGILIYATAAVTGRFDIRARRGTLEIAPHPRFGAGVDLENALRQFLQVIAVARGGFLLHAAGVLYPGRSSAQLFLGPSGSGKTTIARLMRSAGARVVSDDLVFVECRAGGPTVGSTPFRGTLAPTSVLPRALPLAAMHLLRKATEPALEPVPPGAAAAAHILANVPFAGCFDAALRSRLLESVTRVTQAVPLMFLSFRRDASFLPLVGGAPPWMP